MSHTTPSGAPRKPGDKLPGTGEPAKAAGDAAPKNPPPTRRSAGAPAARAPQRPGAKPGDKPGGRPAAKTGAGKAKGRPITPVKVAGSRNWASIALFTAVGLVVVAILGYTSWQAVQGSKTWQDRAGSISGISDYTKDHEKELAEGNGNHVAGKVTYFATPSAGGKHNGAWQSCMGDVYAEQISPEHATHSLEHGAVWVTYDPKVLSAGDVKKLGDKVKGKEYMLMSPFPGQSSAISLQAWGYQLKVNSVGDDRIDDFIKALRQNASVEPGATCSGGITATGTEPQGEPAPPPTAPAGTPAPTASPAG